MSKAKSNKITFKSNGIKSKSIRGTMIKCFGTLFVGITLAFSLIFYSQAKKANIDNTMNIMNSMSTQSANLVLSKLSEQKEIGHFIVNNPIIKDVNAPLDEKMKILKENKDTYEHINIGISGIDGQLHLLSGEVIDVHDEQYFKDTMGGAISITSPFKSATSEPLVIAYELPIKDNSGKVIGLIEYLRPASEISDAITDITFLKTGESYMIDSTGVTIAHKDEELVNNKSNTIEEAKNNPELQYLANIEAKMIKGENGIDTYTYKGAKKTISYGPVGDTGWSIATTVEYDDILSGVKSIEITGVILTLISITIGIIITILFAQRLSSALNKLTKKVELIANGDFTVDIDKDLLTRNDEVGTISKTMNNLKSSISNMILNIRTIGDSIDSEATSLSAFSEELASSTNNISIAITEVANGNTQQSSSISDISINAEDFSNKLEVVAGYISNVHTSTDEIDKKAKESKGTVLKVEQSIGNFDAEFTEFNKNITLLDDNMKTVNSIINLINGISDQTNLLALNAAIEAARAGEMGRGFAVVADEIRTLAEQSKSSAEEIYRIITLSSENTNAIVEKTNSINNELAKQKDNIKEVLYVFDDIAHSVADVIPELNNTYQEFVALNDKKDNIVANLEDVSAVSEEVSASSEEISASSQELNQASEDVANSAQGLTEKTSDIMSELNKFKL